MTPVRAKSITCRMNVISMKFKGKRICHIPLSLLLHPLSPPPLTMGYPSEIFRSPPLDSCICPICHDVIQAAVAFTECGHTFCDECAQECLQSNSCPTCRKQVSSTVPSYFASETIRLMEVACPNQHDVNERNKRAKGNDGEALAASDGCGWIGKCEALHDHDKICNFKMVACDIDGCDHQCRRKDMASHLSGEGLIHHMNLMMDKKIEGIKQTITADYNKKIDTMDKKIKYLKKQVSDLEAKQPGASKPSDDNEDENEEVKVKVEGCGIVEINGTYKQCGMYHGAPKFCKSGQWRGRDVDFAIFRSPFTLYNWFVGILAGSIREFGS
jgi:hypothetical protein